MAYQIKAGVIKQGSNYLGGGTTINAQTFNVNDIENARVCYLMPPDPFVTDLSANQLDGGVLSANSPLLTASAKIGVDFEYRSGADFRRERYFIDCTSTAYYAALASTTQYIALSSANSYTVLG